MTADEPGVDAPDIPDGWTQPWTPSARERRHFALTQAADAAAAEAIEAPQRAFVQKVADELASRMPAPVAPTVGATAQPAPPSPERLAALAAVDHALMKRDHVAKAKRDAYRAMIAASEEHERLRPLQRTYNKRAVGVTDEPTWRKLRDAAVAKVTTHAAHRYASEHSDIIADELAEAQAALRATVS